MDDAVHIAIPSDDKYWFYAAVTAYTASRDSSLPVVVHLIDGGVSDGHFAEFSSLLPMVNVVRHKVDASRWSAWHGSGITWSRLYLTEILTGVDWVLSADADIMFRGDVAELWSLRDARFAVMASRDNPLPGFAYNEKAIGWYRNNGLEFKDPSAYFCAGLALLNLAKMRRDGWAERRDAMMSSFDCSSMPNADQCVLNYILQGDKSLLPRCWGAFSGDANDDIDWLRPSALHFVEDAPWRRRKVTQLVSDAVVEWWMAASEATNGKLRKCRFGCSGCIDWMWRRGLYVALKHNQWILGMSRCLRLHFRNTCGIPKNHVECAKLEVNSAMAQRVAHLRKMISPRHKVVVSCHTGVMQNILTAVRAKLTGRKAVKEICDWPLSVIWKESRVKQWIEVNVLPKFFDGAICMTDVLVDFWIQHGREGCPIFKLPMTVDVQEVDKVGKDDAHLIPYVCYAGGLSEEKDGVETLKKSFEIVRSKLASTMPNLQLKILNGMSHDDVLREMKSAACLVLARPDSLQARAGFPTKLGEYLSTGRPVVVTKVGEIPQFLEDGISAFLVDAPDDRNILAVNVAEKMIQVLTHPEQAEVVGARGRLVAKKCFDWHVHAKELNAWLERFDSREKKKR